MTVTQISRPIVSALTARLPRVGDGATLTISLAADLVVRVHDDDQAATRVLRDLDRDGLEAVALVLAAMVPDHKTLGELLDWLTPALPPVTPEQAAENRRILVNALVGEEFDGGEKRCGLCQVTKLVGEFYRDSSRPDGLRYACKPCHNEVRASLRVRSDAA